MKRAAPGKESSGGGEGTLHEPGAPFSLGLAGQWAGKGRSVKCQERKLCVYRDRFRRVQEGFED